MLLIGNNTEGYCLMNKIGYHGTCSKYRNSIDTYGLDPDKVKYRSDHWLGQGVYFFDDYTKALWWAKIISSHNGNCGGLIYEAKIEAPDDEVLNLDDYRHYDKFLTSVIENISAIEECCSGQIPIFENSNFRAVFFDYYKNTNGISVIIATFKKEFATYTKKRSPSERKLQKKVMNFIDLGYCERQVCVSKKECIKSFEVIYDESNQVDEDDEVV